LRWRPGHDPIIVGRIYKTGLLNLYLQLTYGCRLHLRLGCLRIVSIGSIMRLVRETDIDNKRDKHHWHLRRDHWGRSKQSISNSSIPRTILNTYHETLGRREVHLRPQSTTIVTNRRTSWHCWRRRGGSVLCKHRAQAEQRGQNGESTRHCDDCVPTSSHGDQLAIYVGIL
jgi:hypothetical protein